MTPTFSTAAERRAYHALLHKSWNSYEEKRAAQKHDSQERRLRHELDELAAFYTTKKKRDEAAWKEINKVVIKKA
jgi:hypothetical protein